MDQDRGVESVDETLAAGERRLQASRELLARLDESLSRGSVILDGGTELSMSRSDA